MGASVSVSSSEGSATSATGAAMHHGVSVRNRFFGNDDLNAVFTGALVLVLVVLIEQLVQTTLFATRGNILLRHVNRYEIYRRIYHLQDLPSLLRGTERRRSKPRTPERVSFGRRVARLWVPLGARLTLVLLELLLVVYGGTRDVQINDPRVVPTTMRLNVPGRRLGDCREYLEEGRGAVSGASVIKCTKLRRIDGVRNKGNVSTLMYFRYYPLSSHVFQLDHDGLSGNIAVDVSGQYRSTDGETRLLTLFERVAKEDAGFVTDAIDRIDMDYIMLNEALRLAALRAGVAVLEPFSKRIDVSFSGLYAYNATLSLGDKDNLFMQELEQVLRVDVGLSVGDERMVFNQNTLMYVELDGAGVYVLQENRIDNVLLVGLLGAFLVLNVGLKHVFTNSVSFVMYRTLTEALGQDCLASPTATQSSRALLLEENGDDKSLEEGFSVDSSKLDGLTVVEGSPAHSETSLGAERSRRAVG